MPHSVELDGTNFTVRISGRLDVKMSPAVQEDITPVIDDARDITFDLDGLEYISSAGLRVLLATYKYMMNRGSMRLENVGPEVMEILELSGFASIFQIE